MNILEFENERFIKALKVEKQKMNKNKQLNILGEKSSGSCYFSHCGNVLLRNLHHKKWWKKSSIKKIS